MSSVRPSGPGRPSFSSYFLRLGNGTLFLPPLCQTWLFEQFSNHNHDIWRRWLSSYILRHPCQIRSSDCVWTLNVHDTNSTWVIKRTIALIQSSVGKGLWSCPCLCIGVFFSFNFQLMMVNNHIIGVSDDTKQRNITAPTIFQQNRKP